MFLLYLVDKNIQKNSESKLKIKFNYDWYFDKENVE